MESSARHGIPPDLFAEVEAERLREAKAWVRRLTVLALSVPTLLPIIVLAVVFLPKLLSAGIVAQFAVLAPWAKKFAVLASLGKKGVAAPIFLAVVAWISVPKRRFAQVFASKLFPLLAAGVDFDVVRSERAGGQQLSRLRNAVQRTLPYESVRRVAIESRFVVRDRSGRTDLTAGNVLAYQRTWRQALFRRQPETLVFSGIAAVVRLPQATSIEAMAARAHAHGGWSYLHPVHPEADGKGLPDRWKLFHKQPPGPDNLPELQVIRTVTWICANRCDASSVLAVACEGNDLVVLLDTRDRMFACLRPERIGGTGAMIDIVRDDLSTLRQIADAMHGIQESMASVSSRINEPAPA